MATNKIKWPLYHILIGGLAIIMLYPILWMIMSSFKESRMVFVTAKQLFPNPWEWGNYAKGWEGVAGYSFGVFIKNSLVIVLVATFGAVISSSLVAFGFARNKFVGHGLWFGIMMMTLMLPSDVVLVPQYIIYTKLDWLDSIRPIVIPQFFGIPFFTFLMIQFIRTIPGELDEAATIDGCGKFGLYFKIILPLIRPSMATAAIFSFYWRWEDLLGPVLYLNSPSKYTVSMGLKMFLDSESVSNWGPMFAMSVLSLAPVMLIFFIFQKQIVDGISTSGLKG